MLNAPTMLVKQIDRTILILPLGHSLFLELFTTDKMPSCESKVRGFRYCASTNLSSFDFLCLYCELLWT